MTSSCNCPVVSPIAGAENSISHLVAKFLSLPSMRKEEKGIFERACFSLEVNKFVSDELQPDEEFHGLLNKAIDSLYGELQKGLEYTDYGIHNLIKVTAETASCPFSQALNYRL